MPLKKNVKAKPQVGQGYFEQRQIFVEYSMTTMNSQKIAFERLGRQTFVDFCFIFTKIELYKNLPIDVLILDGIYVQVEAVQDLRGVETKNHSRQIFVDFYIKCSKIEIHKNLPKPQLQEVDVGWFLGKFL